MVVNLNSGTVSLYNVEYLQSGTVSLEAAKNMSLKRFISKVQ